MAQKQLRFHWRSATSNLADYWTKHHSGANHKIFRSKKMTPVHKVLSLFKVGNQEVS